MWVSVSEAAKRLNVSARAVQKRAQRGTLAARKVERDGAEVWEIDGRELPMSTDAATGANTDANTAHDGREPATSSVRVDANTRTDGRERGHEPDANTADPTGDATARLLAQMERENAFLRGVIEQLQRDGAETRQALKRALDLAPRQLTTGTPEAAPEIATETPQNAPEAAESAAASHHSRTALEQPQRAENRAESGKFEGLRLIRDGLRRILKR
jgi:hypothetical protein